MLHGIDLSKWQEAVQDAVGKNRQRRGLPEATAEQAAQAGSTDGKAVG